MIIMAIPLAFDVVFDVVFSHYSSLCIVYIYVICHQLLSLSMCYLIVATICLRCMTSQYYSMDVIHAVIHTYDVNCVYCDYDI